MGLKPTEIADGYEMALEKALSVLETLSCAEIKVSLQQSILHPRRT